MVTATASALIEAGMGSRGEELMEDLSKANKKLAARYTRYFNKLANGESGERLARYSRRVNQSAKEVLSTAKKATVAHAKEEAVKKAADEGQKAVRGVKDDEKK